MNRVFIILLSCVLVSCRTHEKVVYFQDAEDRKTEQVGVYQGIKIQPKDVLSIIVSSTEPALSMKFNLPLHTYYAGSTISASSYSQQQLGYTVDVDGCIDFPILGKLKVAGLTRDQLSEMIKKRMIDDGEIQNPIIVTEFMNFRITVLGEVRTPGTFYIAGDRITLFEALGRAGDLTLYGRRDNVLVQRIQDGVRHEYVVDLRSTSITQSPVFYLQQSDLVYVTPNNTMAARSRINENRTLGVGISLASLITNVVVLLFLR